MNAEQKLQIIIGQMVMQLSQLQSIVDDKSNRIEELEKELAKYDQSKNDL